MVRLYIRHAVEDFDAWLAGHRARAGEREAAGVKADGLARGLDDPNEVTLWHDFADEAAARRFGEVVGDRDAAARMGIKSDPIVWVTMMA